MLGMRSDYVAQVDEFVGVTELGESNILHCFVDFTPMFLTFCPFILNLSVWFLRHLRPILS